MAKGFDQENVVGCDLIHYSTMFASFVRKFSEKLQFLIHHAALFPGHSRMISPQPKKNVRMCLVDSPHYYVRL